VLLSAGGWATWRTNTQRDAAGYLAPKPHTVATAGRAITSVEVGELADHWWGDLLGNVRIRATSTDPSASVFIGVAPTAAVNTYLAGVPRTAVTDWFPVATHDVPATGATPTTLPANTQIWTAHVSGTGTQSLAWEPRSDTTVVVMRSDASAGASAVIGVGAKVPDLAWAAVVLIVIGVLMLGTAIALIVIPVRRASR